MEQVPPDSASVTDYDELTAMPAPRPILLIYNHYDYCCFRSERTRESIFRTAKPVFDLYGVPENIEFHDNHEPGTHNYGEENRGRLYRFLNRHFDLTGAEEDLEWKQDLHTEKELLVGIPEENRTIHTLAWDAAVRVEKERNRSGSPDHSYEHEVLRLALPFTRNR